VLRNGKCLPHLNTNHAVTVEVKNLHVITYAYFNQETIINVSLRRKLNSTILYFKNSMGNTKSLARQIINGRCYVILANITAGNQSLLIYCETDAIWLHSEERLIRHLDRRCRKAPKLKPLPPVLLTNFNILQCHLKVLNEIKTIFLTLRK
jgi:hypothetical protein